MARSFGDKRPPDSWRRGQRRPRRGPINWPAVARAEGWIRGEPARRTDTDVAAQLRCSRSLVSRKRAAFGALPYPRPGLPPVDDLMAGGYPIRLGEVEQLADGSRARARRWLAGFVDAGLLVAVGSLRNRRWVLPSNLTSLDD